MSMKQLGAGDSPEKEQIEANSKWFSSCEVDFLGYSHFWIHLSPPKGYQKKGPSFLVAKATETSSLRPLGAGYLNITGWNKQLKAYWNQCGSVSEILLLVASCCCLLKNHDAALYPEPAQVLAGNQKGFARAVQKSGVPRDQWLWRREGFRSGFVNVFLQTTGLVLHLSNSSETHHLLTVQYMKAMVAKIISWDFRHRPTEILHLWLGAQQPGPGLWRRVAGTPWCGYANCLNMFEQFGEDWCSCNISYNMSLSWTLWVSDKMFWVGVDSITCSIGQVFGEKNQSHSCSIGRYQSDQWDPLSFPIRDQVHDYQRGLWQKPGGFERGRHHRAGHDPAPGLFGCSQTPGLGWPLRLDYPAKDCETIRGQWKAFEAGYCI